MTLPLFGAFKRRAAASAAVPCKRPEYKVRQTLYILRSHHPMPTSRCTAMTVTHSNFTSRKQTSIFRNLIVRDQLHCNSEFNYGVDSHSCLSKLVLFSLILLSTRFKLRNATRPAQVSLFSLHACFLPDHFLITQSSSIFLIIIIFDIRT